MSRRPYNRPMSTTTWYMRNSRYKVYVLRELTSLLVGFYTFLTIFALAALASDSAEVWNSFLASQQNTAMIVFHGFAFRPENAQPGAQPFDLAEGVKIPMLVLHGTEDEQAPIKGMRRMEDRLRVLGKVCEFKFYDGVRHGFAVRTHPGYDSDAAKRSFEEARRFMDKHLQSGRG